MTTRMIDSAPQATWFVGASYGGTDDQMPRFLAEGIWENGYDDKLLDVVRSMCVFRPNVTAESGGT